MAIRKIQEQDLLELQHTEGLILQGCGGDPAEWLHGINETFTANGILLEQSQFQEEQCAVFHMEDVTCILFCFNKVKLDIGKLAMWRLGTHAAFGGTWLSDYVDGLKERMNPDRGTEKPTCPLIGADGNIFNLLHIASRTLRNNNRDDQAEDMVQRVTSQANNYAEALGIIGEYVSITAPNEDEKEGMSMF